MSTLYVEKNGQRLGPYTAEDLEEKVVDGVFTPHDLFWTEGMEEWQPLGTILEVQAEPDSEGEAAATSTPFQFEEPEEGALLCEVPDARLTTDYLHLGHEDIPVHSLLKATVETEKIHRTKPIIGSVILGVAVLCVAFIDITRPHLTAWIIWGVVLIGLFVWWLRVFSAAIRSGQTILVVDLRDGDERLLHMDLGPAAEMAVKINEAVIESVEH